MPIDNERKLVAIFAADVEGYSRLMEADEVRTLKDLTQRRARPFDSVRETVRHYDHFTNASRRLSLLLEQRHGTWVAKQSLKQ